MKEEAWWEVVGTEVQRQVRILQNCWGKAVVIWEKEHQDLTEVFV